MSGMDDTGNDAHAGGSEQYEPEDWAGDVTTHSSSDGRVVFTESGNSDGWIATDRTVTVQR